LRALLFIILFVLGFVLVATLGVGFFLAPQNKLERADAIVVVSGGDTSSRVTTGVALYKEGWAEKLIFSGAAREGTPNAWAMRRQALEMGVPEERILVEPKARDTFENALFVAEIIKEKEIGKIILVTSPYHQRRAFLNFARELGPRGVKILNYPTKDSAWHWDSWWQSSWGRKITLEELKKVFYTKFFYRYILESKKELSAEN